MCREVEEESVAEWDQEVACSANEEELELRRGEAMGRAP